MNNGASSNHYCQQLNGLPRVVADASTAGGYSKEFSGFCAAEPVGRICPKGIPRRALAGVVFGSGNNTVSWVKMWRTFLADLDELGWLDWEETFVDASVFPARKGGDCVGKTKRGKGTKCMVVADGHGVPVGLRLTSASPAEVTLLEPTLDYTRVATA